MISAFRGLVSHEENPSNLESFYSSLIWGWKELLHLDQLHVCNNMQNEMVSTGDTENSLHIRPPWNSLANFFFGGGGYSGIVKTQSAKSWPNFNFRRRGLSKLKVPSPGQISFFGGGILGPEQGVNWDFWTQIYPTGASLCITDSLSHTTYVETKNSLI